MDITQEEQQRKEFCDILFSLADSQIALKRKANVRGFISALKNYIT